MTLGFDGKTLNFFALQLTDQGAQLFSQLHIRAQLRRFFRRKAGHVERVGDAARYQIVGKLLGDLDGDINLRLAGRSAKMRSGDEIGRAEKRDRKSTRLNSSH